MASTTISIPPQVKQRVEQAQQDEQRLVVMTCGLCGSGKSTLARLLTTTYSSFTRLSIDANILSNNGVYEVDYPASELPDLQSLAEKQLLSTLKSLLNEGKRDVVLDLSFYSKDWREEYRRIVQDEGKGKYEVLLVVYRGREEGVGDEELLWKRIEKRNDEMKRRLNAGERVEGMAVKREQLRGWLKGFEWPNGEGEVLVEVL